MSSKKNFKPGQLVETTEELFIHEGSHWTMALQTSSFSFGQWRKKMNYDIKIGTLGTVTGYVNIDPGGSEAPENQKRLWVFFHKIGKEVLIKKKFIKIVKE